jgi:hypothetical protein
MECGIVPAAVRDACDWFHRLHNVSRYTSRRILQGELLDLRRGGRMRRCNYQKHS